MFLKMPVSHEDQGMGPQTSPRVMLFYALPGYTDHRGPLRWPHLPAHGLVRPSEREKTFPEVRQWVGTEVS